MNRIVRCIDAGLEYEADPRHVELLSSSMGLSASNSVSTSGLKDPHPDYVNNRGEDMDCTEFDDDFNSKGPTIGSDTMQVSSEMLEPTDHQQIRVLNSESE